MDGPEVNFKYHIIQKSRLAALNLRNIMQFRQYLNVDSCKALVQALVMSHLDYSNAVFVDLPTTTLAPAQRVQNFAARVILGRRRFESATAALRELHWLPIAQRCKFKLLLLVYKCLHGQAPKYLSDLLVVHQPRRDTRSARSEAITLSVPRTTRSTFAARSFSVTGPKYWNKLPVDIKKSDSVMSFRKKLKTHLFNENFNT